MRSNVVYKGLSLAISAVLCATLTACQNTPSQLGLVEHSLNAEPSFFEPPKGDLYSVQGEIKGAKLRGKSSMIEQETAQATGSVRVTDGILDAAEIVATIDSVHHLTFELTEPAVFERKGEMTDLIVGVGKLTTDTAVYPEVKVLLHPKKGQSGTTMNAVIEIPDALQLQLSSENEPLELELTLEKTSN